jgi:CubicO group peptidase (beta-lactamase class C family)
MQFDRSVSARGHEFRLQGTCDPAFAKVADAFTENFAVEEEIGAATCLYVDGRKVVDLWGGYRDAAASEPWQDDTILCMMSVAKGIAGMAFNILIDRGLVDPDAPVARYWPEFAQNGKEGVLVRHVLDHTAGLPVVLEPLWKGAVFDCDAIVAALEKQAPLWEPGTVAAYHIHTQGNLLGEIARRVTGKRFPRFIADEMTGPLGADYQYGNLSDADLARCATLVPTVEGTLLAKRDSEPDTLVAKGFTQFPDEPLPVTLNSTAWRRAEITSASGHGNPRAVARIYGAVARGGELDGVRADVEADPRGHARRAAQPVRAHAAAPLSPGPRHPAQHAGFRVDGTQRPRLRAPRLRRLDRHGRSGREDRILLRLQQDARPRRQRPARPPHHRSSLRGTLTMAASSQERVAAVTGGAGGIGEACVARLRATGFQVVVLDRNMDLAREVAARHGAVAREIDLADTASIDEAARWVEREVGPCSALAAVAAHLENPHMPEKQDEAEWDAILRVNLTGTFRTLTAFGAGMLERRAGSIVTVGSITAFNSSPLQAYGPDQGGDHQHVAQLRRRLGPPRRPRQLRLPRTDPHARRGGELCPRRAQPRHDDPPDRARPPRQARAGRERDRLPAVRRGRRHNRHRASRRCRHAGDTALEPLRRRARIRSDPDP